MYSISNFDSSNPLWSPKIRENRNTKRTTVNILSSCVVLMWDMVLGKPFGTCRDVHKHIVYQMFRVWCLVLYFKNILAFAQTGIIGLCSFEIRSDLKLEKGDRNGWDNAFEWTQQNLSTERTQKKQLIDAHSKIALAVSHYTLVHCIRNQKKQQKNFTSIKRWTVRCI